MSAPLPSKAARLGFGVAPASGTFTGQEMRALLNVAYESGIRHFDTAPIYGWGEGETVMGAFAAERGDVTVVTKVGISPPSRGARLLAKLTGSEAAAQNRQFSPAQVRRSVEQSLARLGTERLNGLLLHEPEIEDVSDELIGTLEALKREGKIAATGVAGAADTTVALITRYPSAFQIAQIPAAGLSQIGALAADVDVIAHSVLGHQISAALDRFEADQALAETFQNETGNAADDRSAVAQALLRVALARNPRGVTLFSSSREAVVKSNAQLTPASEALIAIINTALGETSICFATNNQDSRGAR